MTYRHPVGELRPSQVLFSYGVGALADLPNLSVMIMGLEDWDKTHTIELSEERLLAAVRKKLGQQVNQLLSPPIPQETATSAFDEAARVGIPVAPFPAWMVCPNCRLLAPLQSGFFELKANPYRPDQTYYIHKNCRRTKQKKPPAVVPVRFLAACENGHLDEFPWSYFVHRCNTDCKGPLRLEERGVSGSTTDIFVKCQGCDAPPRPLSNGFGESGKKNMPCCRGRHPHLRTFNECDKQMKGILLGASNSWFSMTLPALSIPTSSERLEQLIDHNWASLKNATSPEMLQQILAAMQAAGMLQEFNRYPMEKIWAVIEQKQQGHNRSQNLDLKTPEWEVFSQADSSFNTAEFQLQAKAAPEGYENYFVKTVLVQRLREVRALIGFTRLQSPGDFFDAGEVPEEYCAPLSRYAPKWVPTTEVKGEGIFLEFNESAIAHWEERAAVKDKHQEVAEAHQKWCRDRQIDPKQVPCPPMRYLLIHSFSHALMRQLALDCGYNAASLRERIYSASPQEETGPQAGLLIYTAAPDSEGTLGGLVSLGEPKTLGYHIAQGLEQMKLCASDPLCAVHVPSSSTTGLHWAACHACAFTPETSCERGNKYLHRAVLTSTLETDSLAFFNE